MEGNFLNMPFEEASFDGAYAIEATCHAPKVPPSWHDGVGILNDLPQTLLGTLLTLSTTVCTSDHAAPQISASTQQCMKHVQ